MKFRQALFWDTNPSNIDTRKNAQYIIERILDLGTDKEIKWLYGFYDKSELRKVVSNPRALMPETKSLWSLILKSK